CRGAFNTNLRVLLRDATNLKPMCRPYGTHPENRPQPGTAVPGYRLLRPFGTPVLSIKRKHYPEFVRLPSIQLRWTRFQPKRLLLAVPPSSLCPLSALCGETPPDCPRLPVIAQRQQPHPEAAQRPHNGGGPARQVEGVADQEHRRSKHRGNRVEFSAFED